MAFYGTALRGIFDNKGDIAIDDVSVTVGHCGELMFDSKQFAVVF